MVHGVARAQDERQMRRLLGEDFHQQELINLGKSTIQQSQVKWQAQTPLYQFDVDGDGSKESLMIENKDSRIYATMLDRYNRPMVMYEFKAQGAYAEIPKVHLRELAPGLKVLVFHFFRGKTEYTEFYSSGKLYFALIRNVPGNVPVVKFSEGPAYYEEQYDGQKHYHKKPMLWELHDYNNDGIQEIVVTYNKINRIYIYNNDQLQSL
jgi:hypothetical protein